MINKSEVATKNGKKWKNCSFSRASLLQRATLCYIILTKPSRRPLGHSIGLFIYLLDLLIRLYVHLFCDTQNGFRKRKKRTQKRRNLHLQLLWKNWMTVARDGEPWRKWVGLPQFSPWFPIWEGDIYHIYQKAWLLVRVYLCSYSKVNN